MTNIVDIADNVVKSYTYDAYGNTSGSGAFVNSFAYTGAVIDPETGLYYMNARYYEPETGRFISQDTYRGNGETYWNLYMYCSGDPANKIDATGQSGLHVDNFYAAEKESPIVKLVLLKLLACGKLNRKTMNISISSSHLKTRIGHTRIYTECGGLDLTLEVGFSLNNNKNAVINSEFDLEGGIGKSINIGDNSIDMYLTWYKMEVDVARSISPKNWKNVDCSLAIEIEGLYSSWAEVTKYKMRTKISKLIKTAGADAILGAILYYAGQGLEAARDVAEEY